MNNKGYTLAELLVVIVFISSLFIVGAFGVFVVKKTVEVADAYIQSTQTHKECDHE